MSEYRHYTGRLKRIASGDREVEIAAENIMKARGHTGVPDYADSWTEFLEDLYGEYVRVNHELYSVEREEMDDQDVFVAKKTDNGYEFHVQYYDGGMSFDDAIEEAIGNSSEQ